MISFCLYCSSKHLLILQLYFCFQLTTASLGLGLQLTWAVCQILKIFFSDAWLDTLPFVLTFPLLQQQKCNNDRLKIKKLIVRLFVTRNVSYSPDEIGSSLIKELIWIIDPFRNARYKRYKTINTLFTFWLKICLKTIKLLKKGWHGFSCIHRGDSSFLFLTSNNTVSFPNVTCNSYASRFNFDIRYVQ